MSLELHDVMTIAVQTVNYVEKSILHSRCFAALCDTLSSDHLQLLYHWEIRWLSKERVFNRVSELRHQVFTFLNDQRSPLAEHYIDHCFCKKLTYLADVFDQLNTLSLSIQGKVHYFSSLIKLRGLRKRSVFGKEE